MLKYIHSLCKTLLIHTIHTNTYTHTYIYAHIHTFNKFITHIPEKFIRYSSSHYSYIHTYIHTYIYCMYIWIHTYTVCIYEYIHTYICVYMYYVYMKYYIIHTAIINQGGYCPSLWLGSGHRSRASTPPRRTSRWPGRMHLEIRRLEISTMWLPLSVQYVNICTVHAIQTHTYIHTYIHTYMLSFVP